MQTQCLKAPRYLALSTTCLLLGVTSIVALSARLPRPPSETPIQAGQAAIAMSQLHNQLQQLTGE